MSDATLGLTCAGGAVLLFGTNYIPVRKYDCGDGFFFQWVTCCGIWIVGVIVSLLHPYSDEPPQLVPLAMFGGASWAAAQLAVPFIVTVIGNAKGLIIWGSTAMMAGWACGAFGLLGVRSEADQIRSWPLNVAGLLLALVSLALSLLLRSEAHPHARASRPGTVKNTSLAEALLEEEGRSKAEQGSGQPPPATDASLAGVCSALIAGLFFGTCFNPAQHVIDRAGTPAYPHASRHGLDYVPSQFTGIFLTSTVAFAIYAVSRRGGPDVRAELVLPGLLSGVMWGTADALWFVANEQLGFVVAFPIIFSGPGIVASLVGIFCLGELKGAFNMLIAALVSVLVTVAAVLISLSHVA